ncbi:MAG: hypothetical protein LBQ66_03160 [Planctomycetaceae bacterium]|jgi:flagellin-like hook-associated protein FlgL|nr:hypothetical protein [Planctomycetaceae bacterium]
MTGLFVASNPTALSSQFSLVSNMGGLADTLERLSTGLKINSGKDDPAGLIASSLLKAEIVGTTKAITNTQRANSMIATADSSLGQINSLLTDIKGLVVEGASSATMNASMIAANQMQINAAVDAIDRIAKQTTYNGQKLLDGTMSFRTQNADLAGDPNTLAISDLQIDAANFGTANSLDVNVHVLEAARAGTLYYNGTGVAVKTTVDITGSIGTQSFTFGANATNAEIAAQVNAASDSTGVKATVEGLASRGTAVLSSAGANNDIVITAKELGSAAGNYAFKVVYGDQEGARIASQATSTSPGVVEVMLQRSYHRTYENFADFLNVDMNTGTGSSATGVTLKKGDTTSAVYHETATNTSGSNQDGTKTLTINGGTASSTTTVANADMSKLNGWTINIAGIGTNADEVIDYDAKVITVRSASATAVNADIGAAIFKITGQTQTAAAGSVITTGAALAVGDTFVINGGGAAGELELTYKEGATVDDIMKAANNSSGNVKVSLAKGVSGSDLVEMLQGSATNPTRVFSTTSIASDTTSTATANDVISLLRNNATLNNLFDFELLSGDSGDGLVGFMDGSVTSGDVNLDNAIRFTGMDSGPVIRMVTTNPDGSIIKNQKLSVSLINPTEADIAAGRNTPILQINLATDGSGNSITTAKDIVALFNSLTPEETGGISASLLLPDGVDPNGRIWVVDESCGDITLIENCDADYGNGIVQPTGVPGNCDIMQNDLVILGQNQLLVATTTTALIGNSAVYGDGTDITGTAAVAFASAGNTITTQSNHEGLNGVSINFTANADLAGFDEETGLLMVYLSPETMPLVNDTPPGTTLLSDALTAAVNGAIAQNWQGIRQFNGAINGPTTVAVVTAATSATAAMTAFNLTSATLGYATHFLADNEYTTGTSYVRGRDVTSAALRIESIATGTEMAGTKVYLEQDDTLTAFANDGTATQDMIKVIYDEATGELRIKANMAGAAISSGKLAELLNNNTDFNATFRATGNFVGATATNPALAASVNAATNWAGVQFTKDIQPAGEFTGGMEIQTAEKATGGTNNTAETSNGIAMTGANDDNQRIKFEATETGSKNFVSIHVAAGSFRTFCPQGNELSYLAGKDAVATINGLAAKADGNNISVNTGNLALSLKTENKVGTSKFTITGGGAVIQLGPNVVSSQQMRLGIGSMLSTRIGGTSGKLFQLKDGGDADITKGEQAAVLADAIVTDAINYVANTRGRLGALQKSSLEPNIAMLQDSLIALSEANQQIEEADFAEESSNLTKYQLLLQSGMQSLALARQLPQYAASLVQ